MVPGPSILASIAPNVLLLICPNEHKDIIAPSKEAILIFIYINYYAISEEISL
jgi:hypothetical protein